MFFTFIYQFILNVSSFYIIDGNGSERKKENTHTHFQANKNYNFNHKGWFYAPRDPTGESLPEISMERPAGSFKFVRGKDTGH